MATVTKAQIGFCTPFAPGLCPGGTSENSPAFQPEHSPQMSSAIPRADALDALPFVGQSNALRLARIFHGFRQLEGVAQASSLLYRGFPIRRCSQAGTACRLEVGDTAGWKPALHGFGSPVPLLGCEISGLGQPGGLPEGSRWSFGGPKGERPPECSAGKQRTPEGVPEAKAYSRRMGPCGSGHRLISSTPPGCARARQFPGGRSPVVPRTTTGYPLATLRVEKLIYAPLAFAIALCATGVLAQESALPAAATGANLAVVARPSSSYTSGDTTVAALNDEFTPRNSRDARHGSYGNWPRTGTQWVQYRLEPAHQHQTNQRVLVGRPPGRPPPQGQQAQVLGRKGVRSRPKRFRARRRRRPVQLHHLR